MRLRTPPSLPVILAIIALLLSALYVAGLIVDWPGWLRGSNWIWVRRVPSPGERFWLMPAALVVGLALAAVAGRGGSWTRRRTGLFLAGLVVLAPLLQLAVAAQHRAQPLSLVVMSAGGFWQEGVRIDDPLAFAREHPARMPGYADVHVRTQPPGWPLAYWALARGVGRFPAAAEAVGGRILRYDCLSPEFAGLETAQLAAGSLRVVILLISGLGVLPLYAIGRRFVGSGAARLAAVGYGYLPALLVFSGRFDVAYALLALAAVWLALRAVVDGRRGAAVALALLVAGGSFFTFTALPVAALALLVAGVAAGGVCGWRDGLRRVVWAGGALAAAVVVFWGGLWLLGVDGPAMWQVSQAIHREYRLNYPAWFLFNLYDLAVFMGIVPFFGAIGAIVAHRRRPTDDGRLTADGRELTNDQRPTANLRALALGWGAAVLLLNLSATVRAETGRLWLFLMPVGMLVGLGWFVERLLSASLSPSLSQGARGPAAAETLSPSLSQGARGSATDETLSPSLSQGARGPAADETLSPSLSQGARGPAAETLSPSLSQGARGPVADETLSPSLSQGARGPAPLLLFAAYMVQALTMGYFLGGRAAEPATPPPVWEVAAGAEAADYQLGDAVALRGYRVETDAAGANLILYWQALDFPRAEQSVFVHALNAAGETMAQSDGPPAAVPMWCWVPGEVVADERRLTTDGPAAGFAVGLYDAVSGQRLPVRPATADDRILLPGAE